MIEVDKMDRSEKITLGLLVAGQIFSIFSWYTKDIITQTVPSAIPWIQLTFGVVASIALDLDVVVTTIGRRDGRRSIWSWLATGGAAIFSAAIALSVAGGPNLGAWLHVAYAVNIFLFAQHISQPKTERWVEPELSIDPPSYEDIRRLVQDLIEESFPQVTVVPKSTPQLSIVSDRSCPHCGAELKNWQSRAAAKRVGSCEFCRPKE